MKTKIATIVSVFIFILFMGCSGDDGESVKCGEINNVSFYVSSSDINISIESAKTDSFKIEYGPTGFTKGTGTSMVVSDTQVKIEYLTASTGYDVYITGICSEVENNVPYKLTNVITLQSRCPGTTELQFFQFNPNELILQLLYRDSFPTHYEIEYGLAGFSLGTGTRISTVYLQKTITGFQKDTAYDFYVRSFCTPIEASAFVKYTYRTMVPCPKPTNLGSYLLNGECGTPNSARSLDWDYIDEVAQNYTVSLIRTVGEAPGSNTITTGYSGALLQGEFCEWIGYYVKAHCSEGFGSEWAGPYYF